MIDIKGASGAFYRFTRLREGRPLSAMGGNFVFCRQDGDDPRILFVGAAENLLTEARARWDEAVRDHAADGLFTRLNISEAVRRREQADIVEGAAPPMNASSPNPGA
jgi:hypothetical protein